MQRIYWAYKGEWFDSPIVGECSQCGARAIVALAGGILAEQTDGTTHVCHPLAGGCNHGFALGGLDWLDLSSQRVDEQPDREQPAADERDRPDVRPRARRRARR